MSCSTCYEVRIPECPDDITILAQLDADTTYFVTITTKFEKKYTQQVLTDSDGSFIIRVADLPEGLFTRHSGDFTVDVRKTLTNCDPETMQFCVDGVMTEFTCVIMSFYKLERSLLPVAYGYAAPQQLETTIGCECPEP